MPQVGPTWGCECCCESPLSLRPHPPPRLLYIAHRMKINLKIIESRSLS